MLDEEDEVLVGAMEDNEDNVLGSQRIFRISELQQVFRNVSEWDPTKRLSAKGGYIEGSIALPESRDGLNRQLRVNISTHPDYDPVLQGDVRGEGGRDSTALKFHPSIIHVVRKFRNKTYPEKEPFPHHQHRIQEFRIDGDDVYIKNKTDPQMDDGRNIPGEDFLFTLRDPSSLVLGSSDYQLNLVVIIPKKQRARKNEMSVESLVSKYVKGRSNQARTLELFKSELESDKLRLRVDIWEESTGEHQVGLSPVIVNTQSRCYGTLGIFHVQPLKSCEIGGRIITIVSEFGLPTNKDYMPKPKFLIFDAEENELTELQDTINQPEDEDIRTHQGAIIFKTRKQPPSFMQIVRNNGWKFKLCLAKKFPGFYVQSEESYYFEFEEHDENICTFCDLAIDFPDQVKRAMPDGKVIKTCPNKRRRVNSSLQMNSSVVASDNSGSVVVSDGNSKSEDVESFDRSAKRNTREFISTARNLTPVTESSPCTAYPAVLTTLLLSTVYCLLCCLFDDSHVNCIFIFISFLVLSCLMLKK